MAWLSKELLLAIHDRQLAEHGGSSGLRDEKLLESALARPAQLAAYGNPEPDIAELAASLAFGLARNHPLNGGNKRTAAVACEVFIELNRHRLDADDAELFPIFLALAEGKLKEKEFARWLRANIRATGVRESRAVYKVTKRKARKAVR